MSREGVKPSQVDDLVKALVLIFREATAEGNGPICGSMSVTVAAGRNLSSDIGAGANVKVGPLGPSGRGGLNFDRDKDILTDVRVEMSLISGAAEREEGS